MSTHSHSWSHRHSHTLYLMTSCHLLSPWQWSRETPVFYWLGLGGSRTRYANLGMSGNSLWLENHRTSRFRHSGTHTQTLTQNGEGHFYKVSFLFEHKNLMDFSAKVSPVPCPNTETIVRLNSDVWGQNFKRRIDFRTLHSEKFKTINLEFWSIFWEGRITPKIWIWKNQGMQKIFWGWRWGFQI